MTRTIQTSFFLVFFFVGFRRNGRLDQPLRGAPGNAHAGGYDAFAAKVNSNGSLQRNTFMGSSNEDEGYAIAVDGSGNVYVAGTSGAPPWGTPVNAYAGGSDAFVAKLVDGGGGCFIATAAR